MSKHTPQDQMAMRLMAWLDGECDEGEAAEVSRLVESHPEWRAMAQEMEALIRGTVEELVPARAPQGAWDGYWEEIEGRLAKPKHAGWALMAAGGMGLVAIGAFKVFEFATHPLVRVGLVVVLAGFLVTFIAVLRGHLLERPRDRYRKVRR